MRRRINDKTNQRTQAQEKPEPKGGRCPKNHATNKNKEQQTTTAPSIENKYQENQAKRIFARNQVQRRTTEKDLTKKAFEKKRTQGKKIKQVFLPMLVLGGGNKKKDGDQREEKRRGKQILIQKMKEIKTTTRTTRRHGPKHFEPEGVQSSIGRYPQNMI